MKQSQPQEVTSPLPHSSPTNRFIEENNKRAYEMLLRIQSQVEANKVVSITPRKDISYE